MAGERSRLQLTQGCMHGTIYISTANRSYAHGQLYFAIGKIPRLLDVETRTQIEEVR